MRHMTLMDGRTDERAVGRTHGGLPVNVSSYALKGTKKNDYQIMKEQKNVYNLSIQS